MAPAVRGQRQYWEDVEDDMTLFIALSLLVTVSTAYLLHQFWTHSLEREEPANPAEPPSRSNSDHLKAA